MSRTIHICQSVRGALRNWKDSDWVDVMRDTETGRYLTPIQVQDYLFNQLAIGHEVIPIGPVCDGFDFGGDGCPGHEDTAARQQE